MKPRTRAGSPASAPPQPADGRVPAAHRPGSAHGNARLLTWLIVAAAVVLLDQASKLAIEHSFAPGQRLTLVPGLFDLTLVYNRGAAFSFLAGAGGWQRWLFTAIGVAASGFIVHLLRRHAAHALFAAALALVLGGALGNVIDRMLRGQVVDFIALYWRQYQWPAFNVADSAITIGAALLVIDELRRMKR